MFSFQFYSYRLFSVFYFLSAAELDNFVDLMVHMNICFGIGGRDGFMILTLRYQYEMYRSY